MADDMERRHVMLEMVVENKETGKVEVFHYHPKWEIVFWYVVAAIYLVCVVSCVIAADYIFAFFNIALSYMSYSRTKDLRKENMMMDFFMDAARDAESEDETETERSDE